MLIQLREFLLNGLTGSHPQRVLNNPPGQEIPPAPMERLDEALRLLLNRLIGDAISPDGKEVDYQRLRSSSLFSRDFRNLTIALNRFDPRQLRSRAEQICFWINLYNVLALHAVIELNVHTSVSERWGGLAFFRQAAYCVGGQRLSLDDIEHGILRANRGHPFLPGPQFAKNDPRLAWALPRVDARIHFALNCASRSCPPIGVYRPTHLAQQLDLAAAHFVEQDIERVGETGLRLSSIFRWYQQDFGGVEGVIDFLLRFLPAGDPRRGWLVENRRSVNLLYRPYDWQLNRL
jgi:hypothetical protein